MKSPKHMVGIEAKAQEMLTNHLNTLSDAPPLYPGWSEWTYCGTIHSRNHEVHVFIGDEDPPFDLWVIARGDEVITVVWDADASISIIPNGDNAE